MKTKKPTQKDKVYIFKVALDTEASPFCHFQNFKQKCWREIAVLSSQTLYKFAEAITDSFGFYFDHCFGFYNNLQERTMYDSKEIYELFTDLPDVEHTPRAKGVEKVKISQVFKQAGKKMLFYFDYGDSWRFFVELKSITSPDSKKTYPLLIKSSGKSPEQYPPME